MKTSADLAPLLEAFFTRRLMGQLRLSPHTIASYRDTFRLMLSYAQKRLKRSPSDLAVSDLNTKFITEFLDDLEKNRTNSPRSRNLRLAAIRSFFRYAALEAPQHSALIQRVLAIPRKRHSRPLIGFLARPEIEALLSVVDRHTWIGQRDYALLLVAIQTGLRLSELTGLRQQDVCVAAGPHIRCVGKGRKERCTPLTKATAAVLAYWMELQNADESQHLFPSTRGGRLSADAVQRLVQKYVGDARKRCPSLAKKRVTPHVMRHTAAMEMLQAGVDRALIAIWLGHEKVDTTQIYLDANLPLKEEILAKTSPVKGKQSRFRASDRLLNFLKNL